MLLNSSFVSLPTFFKPQQLQRTNLSSSNGSLLLCYATSSNFSQRKSVNYQPNIWNYDSLLSLKHDYAVIISDGFEGNFSFFYIYYSLAKLIF